MHVLLTGVTGRLGSRLLPVLLRDGHTVIAIDIKPPPPDFLSSLPSSHQSRCILKTLDYTDYNLLEEVFSSASPKIEWVIHLGAIPAPTLADWREVHKNNVVGSYNVMYTAVQHGVKRIVQASSMNAVGMSFTEAANQYFPYLPIDEDYPLEPEDPYSLSKQIAEAQAQSICRLHKDVRISSLRIHMLCDTYDEAVQRSRSRSLWGWVSFDAVIRACVLSLTSEGWEGAEVFNIIAEDICWEGGIEEQSRRKEGEPEDKTVKSLDLLRHYWDGKVGEINEEWWEDNPRRGFWSLEKAKKMLGWQHDV